jgi:hypothetical protein
MVGGTAMANYVAGEIFEEIRLLQEDIAHRSDCIKFLVGKIPDE